MSSANSPCKDCQGTGLVRVGILTTYEGDGEYCFKRQETIPFATIAMQKTLLRERQKIHEAVAPCKCQRKGNK